MIREYKNQKIYKDFKIVKVLSLISLILAFITLVTFIVIDYLVRKRTIEFLHIDITFMICWVVTPFGLYDYARKAKPTTRIRETKWNNDIANLTTTIVVSFMDAILVIFLTLIGAIFGTMGTASVAAYLLGYSFISHIFSYISAFILIHALINMKKEWKANPPKYYAEEQAKIKEKKELTKKENLSKKCNTLLEKCGMRFFIKYLKQIQTLPLRDVIIEENYSSSERNERLNAAKEIVDLQMVELALNQIIQNYSSALKAAEIENARDLLKEFDDKKLLTKNASTKITKPAPEPTDDKAKPAMLSGDYLNKRH